jgi:hypothetical protein
LQQVEELGKGNLYNITGIQAVEVKTAGTVPVGIYLQVSGAIPGCNFPDGPLRVHQRLQVQPSQSQRFEVNVSALQRPMPLTGCTMNLKPFRVTVPLETYGLPAGSYSYSVNGLVSGNFTLAAANQFANDCDVSKFGNCN